MLPGAEGAPCARSLALTAPNGPGGRVEEVGVTIQHKIVGEAMQMVVCQLGEGQSVYCEAGKFLWKTTNVTMETRLGKPGGNGPGDAAGGAAGGGFFKKAMATATEVGKRALAGESLALQWFRADGTGIVAFAGVLPGSVRALELDGTSGWYTEKDAFVVAESTVEFDISFSDFKTGRKGGEGFVLEKFTGTGTVVIAGAGSFIELNPAKYGGKIQVDTGCVVAFQDSIAYGVERVGALNAQTAMTAAFGGEGLNLATLEGDGQVILQSMTYAGMANALQQHFGSNDRQGLTGGLFGGGND
jgi:uncharacterized protein (AIM24 family)